MAPQTVPKPPTSGKARREGAAVIAMMTPRPRPGHVPGGGSRGDEMGARTKSERAHVVVERHVGQFLPLHIGESDQVERDVDAARLIDDRGEVGLDALWIGRIYLRRAGLPAGSDDLARDRVERVECAPRQEDPSSLPRENPSHGAAYMAPAAIEDRGLVLEQHCASLPSLFGC